MVFNNVICVVLLGTRGRGIYLYFGYLYNWNGYSAEFWSEYYEFYTAECIMLYWT